MKIHFFDREKTENSRALFSFFRQLAERQGHIVAHVFDETVDCVIFDANTQQSDFVEQFRLPTGNVHIIGLIGHGVNCPFVDTAIVYNSPESKTIFTNLAELIT